MKKKLFFILSAITIAILIVGCSHQTPVTSEASSTLQNETVSPKAYASVKAAFAAIQADCMVYFEWPGRINAWVETVYDYLANHPEIQYVPGTGGWGGPSERYDQRGYCYIMAMPLKADSIKNGGVLIYEAMGATGPETKHVYFNGSHDTPIYLSEAVTPPEYNASSLGCYPKEKL